MNSPPMQPTFVEPVPCPACRYDLRQQLTPPVSQSVTCPECGAVLSPSQVFVRNRPWIVRHAFPLAMAVPGPAFMLVSWVFPVLVLSQFFDGPGNGAESMGGLIGLALLHMIGIGVFSYQRKPYRDKFDKVMVAIGWSVVTAVVDFVAIANLIVVLFANWHGC